MKTYEFTLILANLNQLDIDQADAIYAICADATVGVSCGVVHVHFDREAESLEDAVRSAVDDLRAAGHMIDHIETDESVMIGRLNNDLSHAG